jgi:hypothetical protein
MKKLVVVFLCLLASNACASSADSGKCPWKLPFAVTIQASGIEHDYSLTPMRMVVGDTTYHTTIFYIDTIRGFSFTAPDTLMVGVTDNFIEFIFAPKTDSIVSITWESNYVGGDTMYGGTEKSIYGISRYFFRIESLLFDDTSIYSTDSRFSSHLTSYIFYDSSSLYQNNQFTGNGIQSFTASSVTLSGIFRPTTFSDQSAIVTEAPQSSNLAVYASNGSIACSFDVADHARDLEIFSPLGIREACLTIPAGQMEASLPHLPAGFYFVWLDGSMAKVYIKD